MEGRDMAKYRTGAHDEWNPPLSSSGRKRDELDEQMGVLEEGRVLIIEAEDEKELRGRRLALGRRAKALGIAIEQYNQGQTIYARKKEETPEPEPKRRPGRKRRRAPTEPEAAAEAGPAPAPPEPDTTPDT